MIFGGRLKLTTANIVKVKLRTMTTKTKAAGLLELYICLNGFSVPYTDCFCRTKDGKDGVALDASSLL